MCGKIKCYSAHLLKNNFLLNTLRTGDADLRLNAYKQFKYPVPNVLRGELIGIMILECMVYKQIWHYIASTFLNMCGYHKITKAHHIFPLIPLL
jgi:uncharacterized membrane protein